MQRPGKAKLYSGRSMQPVRTRLQVDVRRQQLLELGLQLFGNQTYDELSIDEIAKQAGVSKGLLYHYFPSKRAFYVALVRRAAGELLEETDVDRRLVGRELDPEGIRTRIRAFLEYVSRRRASYAFLLRGGIGADAEVAQIVEEKRGLKEHREQIDKLINTVNMLQRQVDSFMEQYPADLDVLELQQWGLKHLESKMRATRRALYKRHYQLFSRPLTRVSS